MYISIFSYSLRYNISIFSLVNLNTIFTDNQKFNIEMKQVSSKPTTFEKEINSDNVEYTNNSSENEQSDTIVSNEIIDEIGVFQDDENINELQFEADFKECCYKGNMNAKQITLLLNLFRKHNIGNLPLSSRTLMNTPRNIKIKIKSSMHYYHFGLESSLIKNIEINYPNFNESIINLSLNIDGIPLFDSSKESCWPVLACCNIYPYTIFVVTLTQGTKNISKPSDQEFLRDTVDELKVILQRGIKIFKKNIQVKLHFIVCDAPARAMIKKTKLHSGYSACDRCDINGEYINGRVVLLDVGELRTDRSFRLQIDENHHKGESIFNEIVTLDLVRGFPLDYMHCLCLGVMKRLLNIWLGKDKLFKSRKYRITSIQEFNSRIEYLSSCLPYNIFNRRPRSTSCLSYWKATEYRCFLLYIGHMALKDLINESYYKHFLILNYAAILLISENTSDSDVDFAGKLLNYFVDKSVELYGDEISVYNIHILRLVYLYLIVFKLFFL